MALEERLELDAADALRTIDAIETALERAAQSFKVALADALDVLGQVSVGSVDASSVTAGIDAAVAAADLEPVVTADASGVTSSIDDAVAAADTEAQVGADASEVTVAVDAAVADANSQVDVEADASGVTDTIDAAVADADTTVTIDAIADAIGEAIEAAVAAADATVEVDADTAPAEQALTELGQTANTAGDGVDRTRLGLDALSTAAGASTGNLLGSERALAGLGSTGTVVAGGLTALTVSVGAFAKAALESDTADRRFAQSLGEIAEQVANVGIAGFADDLESLAERTGNSDEQLKLAAARIADLGNSAGASQDEIAGAAENILLLATRASVLNPTLGDAGQIADQLTNALARGGRPLAQFGISLTAAQIAAEASARGLGDNVAELTVYERAAIAADLVTKQLGDSLRTDIVEGAEGTEIRLRSLREQFGNALEELGRPLLQPLLDAAREGMPVLVDLASVFGELGSVVLPLVVDALRIAAPVLSTVADVVGLLTTALGPVLAVVGAIPEPLLRAVAAFVTIRAAVLGLQVALAALAPTATLALGPIGLLAAGVAAAATAFGLLGRSESDAKSEVEGLTSAFRDQTAAIRDTIEATAEKRIVDENQDDDLRRLGLTIEEFTDLTTSGAAGFVEFIRLLEQSGEVTPEVAETFRLVAREGISLTEAMLRTGVSFDDLQQSNAGLIRSFTELQQAQQDEAEATLTRLVVQGKVTEAQVRQAEATAAAAGEAGDFVAVLEALELAVGDVADSTGDAVTANESLGASYDDLVANAERAAEALSDYTDTVFDVIRLQDSAEDAERDYADALRGVSEAEADLAEARRDRNDATRDAISAERALNSLEDATAGVTEAERELARAREGRGQRAEALADAERGLAEAQREVAEASKRPAFSLSAEDRAKAAERLAQAQGRLGEAEERLRDAREEGGKEADIADATEKLERAQLDAREAALRLAEAREQAAEREKAALAEVRQAERDLIEARNAAVEAGVAAADAQLELATRLAELTGSPLLPEDRVRLFREALIEVANQATGPTKDAILGVIADLDSLTSTPHAIQLEVDAEQANKQLDDFLKRFDEELKTLSFDVAFNRSALPGGRGGGFPGAMAGGSFLGPGSFVMGEGGREVVSLAPAVSATVLPNRQTEALLAGGGGLDPGFLSAIKSLAEQPRILAPITMPGGAADPYAGAVEAARQLQSLAIRLTAAGS